MYCIIHILLKSNSCIFVSGMRSDIAFIKPILIDWLTCLVLVGATSGFFEERRPIKNKKPAFLYIFGFTHMWWCAVKKLVTDSVSVSVCLCLKLQPDFRSALFNAALLIANDLGQPLTAVPYLKQLLQVFIHSFIYLFIYLFIYSGIIK